MTAAENDGARERALIAELNDAFRRSFVGGQVVITRGVAAMPEDERTALLAAVRAFEAFTPENDPYGERDFGAVTIAGETFFWKIDPYDCDLTYRSPDPSDTGLTRRVLTIMRGDEY